MAAKRVTKKRASPLALADVRAVLRGVGLRVTVARIAVMEHLRAATGPETHAEVSDALAAEGFDRATIYRNLTELTEAGLVSRVDLGDHMWRFEWRRGEHAGRGEDHPHFLCTSCGEVSCLDDVKVAITPKKRPAAAAKKEKRDIGAVTEVLLKGQCGRCQ